MAFRQIDDEFYKAAGQAIDASGKPGTVYPEYDGAELVAAGAALALERGAPRLMAKTYDTGASQYLAQGSRAWAPLHGAVARFSETDLNESEAIASRGDGVKMVVSDVLQRVSARRVIQGADLPDLEPLLNEGQMKMAERARVDSAFRKDMSSIAVGDFQAVSPDMSASLKEALDAPLTGKIGEEVSLMSRAVDGIVDRDEKMGEQMLANEGALGQFSPISKDSMDRVVAFHKDGISTRSDTMDASLKLLSDQGHVPESLNPNEPIMIAQARLLQDARSGFSDAPADLASMALSDADIMTRGRMAMDDPTPDVDRIGQGRYHELDDSVQAHYERLIVFGMKTTPLDKVRLEVGMLENSGIAALDRAHFKQKDETVQIAPENALEVATAADVVMNKHSGNDEFAFVQMGHALIDFRHSIPDPGYIENDLDRMVNRSVVEAAEHLVQTMDDKSMSGSPEWEALSKSVDKAMGHGQKTSLSSASQESALQAKPGENSNDDTKKANLLRAQQMAAQSNGMGM